MKTILLALPLVLAGCLDEMPDESSVDQAATGEQDLHGAPEHLNMAKGAHGGGGGGASSALMTFHGGTVLVTNKTEAVFWGDWSNPGDKVTGLDSFFEGFGGSHYASDSTEYTGTNGRVTTSSTYLGHVFDTSAAPRKALTTNTAVAEACKITNNAPDPTALYLLYTSTGAGHVSYCAWHSWGTCSNGAPVQVAYMPNLDGIAGCDPSDPTGQRSEGLSALANVTAHELSETITDPRGDAWYDASGQENGDKCAWSFPAGAEPVKFSNNTTWWVQGEWSNAAFTANTGFPNLSGQNGCLY